MLKIILIRHGETFGNTKKRYIGKTDEPLLDTSVDTLKKICYPSVEELYSSPRIRCTQTANIIYPHMQPTVVNDLMECNFGDFENKNYKELDGNKNYQSWIDSNGRLPFPNGESIEEFNNRCINAFGQIISQTKSSSIALVVHGGTIMSIMQNYANYPTKKSFYDWHVGNGNGYICDFEDGKFTAQKKIF